MDGGEEQGQQPKTFREKGLDRFWRRKATVKFSTTDDFDLLYVVTLIFSFATTDDFNITFYYNW